jgi:hypothetical protein
LTTVEAKPEITKRSITDPPPSGGADSNKPSETPRNNSTSDSNQPSRPSDAAQQATFGTTSDVQNNERRNNTNFRNRSIGANTSSDHRHKKQKRRYHKQSTHQVDSPHNLGPNHAAPTSAGSTPK